MITKKDITHNYQVPKEYEQFLDTLVERVNKFCSMLPAEIKIVVTSGFRTKAHNAMIGGAKNSRHCFCQAVDLYDPDGKIKQHVKENPDILDECDLYMEDPSHTLTWVHLDIYKRKNRIFKP